MSLIGSIGAEAIDETVMKEQENKQKNVHLKEYQDELRVNVQWVSWPIH